MVAISKILNQGLLLAGQSVYQDVATPEQASVEQYNVIKYLGGSAPYIQRPGYGISTDIPQGCEIQQVQVFSRHGERYPSRGDGVRFNEILEKFKNYKHDFKGPLEFLNNYQYFVTDPSYYEKETSSSNSQGIYAGTTNSLRHGAAFRAKYGRLYKPNTVLPVFTSNSGRCYQTSNYFARGFLGDDYSEDNVKYVVVDEDPRMGANSLTPRYGCKNYDSDINKNKINGYNQEYLLDIVDRFEDENPGLNLTSSDVSSLFLWSAFEINVKGSSPFTKLFTNEEYIRRSYFTDLENYYSLGPGHNFTRTVSSQMLEASMKLLKQQQESIWLSFTHDTDLGIFLSSIGLQDDSELPIDNIRFPNPYSAADLYPQGARVYVEKYQCKGTSYVRYILNDAVVPLATCQNGPGFSCSMDNYQEYVRERLAGNEFDKCELEKDSPAELTFYWDYETKDYNASLIDQ